MTNIRDPKNFETGFGKIPPQARQLEESVIGAIISKKEAFEEVSDILKKEMFYKPDHVQIYHAAELLSGKGDPIDLLTMEEQLKQMEYLEDIGGAYRLSELMTDIHQIANIRTWAKIIVEKWQLRESIRISQETISAAYEGATPPQELIDNASSELDNVSNCVETGTMKGTTQLFTEAEQHIDKARKAYLASGVSGIPTTIGSVNHHTGGWQDTDFIIIAGRPAMGKTAFVKACIQGACKIDAPVGMWSLEMASTQLAVRKISEHVQVPNSHLLQGTYSGKIDFAAVAEKYKHSITKEDLLYIDDKPSRTGTELRRLIKKFVRNLGGRLAIIDYLQLANEPGDYNRNNELEEISKILKQTAKECEIPVIALAQLSRAVETRGGNKKPMLSDLRDSGAIEQNADVVAFLYRPEYYGISGDNGEDLNGFAEFIIAKQRNGALNTAQMRFVDKYTKFMDWDEAYAVVNNQNELI